MNAQHTRQQQRWAPWWLYVVALVVTNQLRTWFLVPADLATWLQAVIGIASMALVATLVTLAWRATRR